MGGSLTTFFLLYGTFCFYTFGFGYQYLFTTDAGGTGLNDWNTRHCSHAWHLAQTGIPKSSLIAFCDTLSHNTLDHQAACVRDSS